MMMGGMWLRCLIMKMHKRNDAGGSNASAVLWNMQSESFFMTMCGRSIYDVETNDSWHNAGAAVTCKTCIKAMESIK